MKEQKVMFFDIDGTLLPHGASAFTPSAVDAIKKAQKNGHLMIVNTGRAYANLSPFMFDVGFDGYICACGTYILLNDELIFYRRTDDDVCKKVRELANFCNIDAVYESWHGVYYEPGNIAHPQTLRLIQELKQKNEIKEVSADDALNFDKFITYRRPDSDQNGFIEGVSKWFDYIDRGTDSGEYMPKDVSKATGARLVLEKLNLPLTCAHAIGDSANDLPMFKYIPHSIAMGNSWPKSLFDEVEYVTKPIDEDGVALALAHYGFI